ncbi:MULTISPECIES: PilZ domain-containing protein [Halomonadaceae]|uniref:PilZ domain-containing protein n=1 Tax=Halomonadaceae TaxID=28256 RepID=UPI00159ACCA9|nr:MULTISPECIES: PilZ domain-containing protein [Halomonas]QJQ95279.1 HlyD family efflux transporter periplasmic adaptor subunit [Halomonas sp. PA5]
MPDPTNRHDSVDRKEPSLGRQGNATGARDESAPASAQAPAGNLRDTSQIQHERRDERQHVRVPAPFQARTEDGRIFDGIDVSMGGFELKGDAAIAPGAVMPISLLMSAGTAELIVPVEAHCLRCHPDDEGQYRAAFRITHIDPAQQEVLRRLIRAYLSGRYASVESLIDDEDPQTPRKRKSGAAAPPAAPPRPWGRYVALFAAAALLVVVGAATAYRNFMLIEPSFAAVTAPRIDIRAPGAGILEDHPWQAGDRVERDQYLTGVNNSDLESDLILARASQSYNERLIENLQESLASGNGQVSMANSAQPGSGDSVSYETASPEIAQARVEQFETVRDYESSRVSALEARMSMNEIHSPCDCLVAWALSSADGTYINESERIMTLIRTGEEDVMVEALVHMSDIARISPDQTAFIALPNASEPIRAQVRSVALDVERQPRAGFPNWVRQQQNVASVLLVPETSLPAEAVGQPVDVRFTETPTLAATAEWIYQGGRAVSQYVTGLYQSVTNRDDESQESASG